MRQRTIAAEPKPSGAQSSAFIARTDHRIAPSGQPLDARIRGQMEVHLGHDFSRVRVHHDAHAAALAREFDADAYTLGTDIVFGKDQWAPETLGGRRLLAHELAHVIQQSLTTHETDPVDGLPVSRASDSTESEARSAATAALGGSPAQIQQVSGPAIQRSADDEDLPEGGGEGWGGGSELLDTGREAFSALRGGIEFGDAAELAELAEARRAASLMGMTGGGVAFKGPLGGSSPALGPLAMASGVYDMYSNLTAKNRTAENYAGAAAGLAETVSGSVGTSALLGTSLGGATGEALTAFAEAAEPVGLVAGAGAAGYAGGKLLDKGANWLGQTLTGDKKGDYSISGLLADAEYNVADVAGAGFGMVGDLVSGNTKNIDKRRESMAENSWLGSKVAGLGDTLGAKAFDATEAAGGAANAASGWLGRKGTEALGGITGAGGRALDWLGAKKGEAASGVVGAGQQAAGWGEGLFNQAAGGLRNFGQQAQGWTTFPQMATGVGHGLLDAANFEGRALSEGIHGAAGAMNGALGSLGGSAEEALGGVGGAVRGGGGWLGQTAGEAASGIGSAATGAWNWLRGK